MLITSDIEHSITKKVGIDVLVFTFHKNKPIDIPDYLAQALIETYPLKYQKYIKSKKKRTKNNEDNSNLEDTYIEITEDNASILTAKEG